MEKIDIEELKEELKKNSRNIIITYLKDKFGEKISHEEWQRIDSIFENTKVTIEEKNVGDTADGTAYNDEIVFKVSKASDIGSLIETLVHEYFHKISKNKFGEKIKFVEEGYVTFATAEAVRNILSKSDVEFAEIFGNDNAENLREILSDASLTNGYNVESSVIRCNDIILRENLPGNIDSIYEYLFNEKGFDRIVELSKGISSQYGKFIENLRFKQVAGFATLFDNEKEVIFEELKRCDLSKYTSESYFEITMNDLLIEYLIDNYDENNSLYTTLQERFPKLSQRFDCARVAEKVEKEKEPQRILEYFEPFFQAIIPYEIEEEPSKLHDKFIDIDRNFCNYITYCSSSFKGSIISSTIMAIIFCYDLSIQNLSEEDEKLQIYIKSLGIYDLHSATIYKHLVKKFYPFVKKRVEKGQTLKDIISEHLCSSFKYDIVALPICENVTSQNFVEVVQKLVDEAINLEKGDDLFEGFLPCYIYISTMCVKKFFNGKSFSEADKFIEEVTKYFKKFEEEYKFYEGLCYTPKALEMTGIAMNININEEINSDFGFELLDALNEDDCNLGVFRGSNNYDKLIYILFLSLKNTPEDRKMELFEKISQAIINEKLEFADSFKWVGANQIYPMRNIYVDFMINELSGKFAEIYLENEEEALEIIQKYPSIIKFFAGGYIYPNPLEDAMVIKILGKEEFEKQKDKNNGYAPSLSTCGFNKLSDTKPGTFLHLYFFEKIMFDTERNFDCFDKNPYICFNKLLKNTNELLNCGYIDKAKDLFKRICKVYDKNQFLKSVNMYYYEYNSLCENVTKFLKSESFSNDESINQLVHKLANDLIDKKEGIEFPEYIDEELLLQIKNELSNQKFSGEQLLDEIGVPSVKDCDEAKEVVEGLLRNRNGEEIQ